MDVRERRFYIVITKILTMNEDDALNYLIESKIKYPSLLEYIRNYLAYNLDNLSNEELKNTKIFLENIRVLYFDIVRGNSREERKQIKIEKFKKAIDENTRKVSQEDYIKNRFLLEEYVDNEEYIYTILIKYRKSYDFFMDLVETASTFKDIYNRTLYEQVNKLFESKEKYVNQEIEKIAPLVLGFINEGIKIGKELVSFNIFDYYANFRIPIEYFFLYNDEKIPKSTLNEIKLFFKKNYPKLSTDGKFMNKKATPFNIEYELKTEYIFNVNGKDIKPSIEEREKVINYLIDNAFPLELVIYKQALRRYANGLLELKPLKRTFE